MTILVTFNPVEQPTYQLETPAFTVYQPKQQMFGELEETPSYSVDKNDRMRDYMDNLLKSETTTRQSTDTTTTVVQGGNYDVESAIKKIHDLSYIDLGTGKKKDPTAYKHWCAKAVRTALQAGGLNMDGRPQYGGQYGKFLESKGWKKMPKGTTPVAGDVAVTTPHGKHQGGHISLYDGQTWYSDAKQKSRYVYSTANDNNTFIYRYVK